MKSDNNSSVVILPDHQCQLDSTSTQFWELQRFTRRFKLIPAFSYCGISCQLFGRCVPVTDTMRTCSDRPEIQYGVVLRDLFLHCRPYLRCPVLQGPSRTAAWIRRRPRRCIGLAASYLGSGNWFDAVPLPSIGPIMDNVTICGAAGVRHGAPAVGAHKCVGGDGLCEWTPGIVSPSAVARDGTRNTIR